MGYAEVLCVTELLGVVLIWIGYRWNVRPLTPGSRPAGHRDVPDMARGGAPDRQAPASDSRIDKKRHSIVE